MSSLAPGFLNIPRSLIREARRRMLLVAMLFSAVAYGALVVGLLLPKAWECSALLVPDASILKPLVEGRGAGGNAESQLATLMQTAQTRRIMLEILTFGGWLGAGVSPPQEEMLLAQLRSRLRIENARDAMIRISYRDSDPKRTFLITNKVVEILVREASSAKETSSRETYEFVERQVKEYGGELAVAHEKLLAYYRSQGSGVAVLEPEDPSREIPSGRRDMGGSQSARVSPEDLSMLRAEEATLAAQLARARPVPAPGESRRAEEQLRARVDQMRFEYERLANSYTERHPDVVRKANELEAAREDLRRLEAARRENDKAEAATSALDDQVARATRVRLEEVRALIAAASQSGAGGRPLRRRASPLGQPSPVADPNLADPDMRRVGQDSKLSELLRRYEATRDVYQDLLKKRETARLFLNLDVERSGVTLRVQEPATMPVIASGLRVMHKTLIGMMLAVAVPLGVLLGIVSFDGRVRSAEQIERLARVPILVTIPYAPSTEGQGRARLKRALAVLLVVGVFAAYVVGFVMSRIKVP
jgi:polysaccharide chain length determinant protein (PEP-CTERM system associated)